jgi:hypothetical protein
VIAVFTLLSTVLTQAKHGIAVLFRFVPTICGAWTQLATVTARKQASPSETTVAEGANQQRAHAAI